MPTNSDTLEDLKSILSGYFTWKGEAIHQVSQTENYKRLLTALIEREETLIREAKIEGIEEAHKKILEIVYTYIHPDEPNYCDVDDVSRLSMTWKIDRISELTKQPQGKK